jgi:hypothetical protein
MCVRCWKTIEDLQNRAANNRGRPGPFLVSHLFGPRGKVASQKADRELAI